MRRLCNFMAVTKLARGMGFHIERRHQPARLGQPWLLICGAVLVFFAFPPLAQACHNFRLEIMGPGMARPGDRIVYTIKYHNLGWPLLKDVTLIGRIPDYTSLVSVPPNCHIHKDTLVCLIGKLREGEGGQGQVTLQVDEDAPAGGLIQAKVLAIGREPGRKLMLLDRAQITTKIIVPKLSITKQPNAEVIYAGQSVTYEYSVTNMGNVSLKNVTLTDDQKSPSLVCDPAAKLRPGAAFSCTWTTTLEADTTNVATVTGLDPWGDPVTATDSAFVNTIQPPDQGGAGVISLEKVASAEAIYAGEMVTYTYTVSNPSDDPVHDISLTDDQLGFIAGPFDLNAGEDVVFTALTALTADTTNVATAEGLNLLGDTVRAQDSALVRVVAPDVDLSLAVTASAARVYSGDTVTYTYVVRNVGSDLAYNMTLVDDPFGTIAGPLDMAGGESRTWTVDQVLYEDTTNLATATAVDGLDKPIAATASASVDTIQRPGPNGEGILSLTVTPSAINVESGTTVTYTYLVTNLSPDPVHNIIVVDDQFGFIAPMGDTGISDVYQGFTLQGGESRTLTFSVALYQNTHNTATATGQDLLLTAISAEATAFVDVWTHGPTYNHVVFLPIVSRNSP